MPRAIWKGSISFGLVNIPVGLYSAEKRNEVHFNLLDRRNMARVRYKRVNDVTAEEVPWDEIVRGFQTEGGNYVVMSEEDLKRASPEKTQTVEILEFVDLDEVDSTFFDKPYYLGPDKKGAKSYALLRETLRRTGKAGIAKVVIRTKEYLSAVVAQGDVMVLNVLRYADELRDPNELDLPSREEVDNRELAMAERLVEGMVGAWDPERFTDTYREDLMELIQRRVEKGQFEAAPEEPVPQPKAARGQVVDLMALLKRSVDATEAGGGQEKKKPAKKAPAKKASAKKKAPAKKPKKAAARKEPATKKRKSA